MVVMSVLAMARNSANELVTNQSISIEISVLNGSNTAVYTETQTVTTNANGVATLVIGEGTATKGTFAGIDWSAGNYYLQTTANLGSGASAIVGTTPLLSVPYALYAEKAGDTYTKAEVDTKIAEAIATSGGGAGALIKGDVKKVNGAIQAAFSISATEKVYFSQGNLQYNAGSNIWRFAENQYDIIGDNNSNISSTYSGWIDLFGWGTSGWNSGANAYQPYSTSTNDEDYCSASNNLTGSYANADWGVYNKISNGGNTAGQWRTLTYVEWNYLLSERTDASALKGSATVNGVTGMILLPDNWTTPSGITFTSGMNGFSNNTYTTSDWVKMEANGAVFLPAAGRRYGSEVNRVGSYGNYWSSSVGYDDYDYVYYFYALYLYFCRIDANTGNGNGRGTGLSVRLVRGL